MNISADTSARLMGPVVTGAPYSAIREARQTSTLADGTHIDSELPQLRFYRDSQGRMRTEVFSLKTTDGVTTQEIVGVMIFDLAAGKIYHLDSRTKTASLLDAGRPRATSDSAGPARGIASTATIVSGPAVMPMRAGESEIKREELGTRMESGLTLTGERETRIYSVGSIGNDREIVATQTTWKSPDLGLTMLLEIHDPRSGDTTLRVSHLDRNEPDPALFELPADYEIVATQ
jgi:hypothetical protein